MRPACSWGAFDTNEAAVVQITVVRSVILFAAVAACTERSPAGPPSGAAPALDDSAAVERAHLFFASVDRRERDELAPIITSGFVLFMEGRAIGVADVTRSWPDATRNEPPRTRTCESEAVHRSAGAVVYVGDCREQAPAHGDAAAKDRQGWNTVVLVPEAGTWKVALWQWQRSGIAAERDHWNEEYRRGVAYTHEPNALLARTVGGVRPGRALDLAMGQGRNALYLAAKGWKVTGVDVADEGVRQAKASAAERGLELDTVIANIDEYDFGTDRWDLVTMIYAGSSPEWIERIKPGLRSGGLFVLEFFYKDPDDTKTWGGTDAATVSAAFTGWKILVREEVDDVADWGKSKARLVRFVARKP